MNQHDSLNTIPQATTRERVADLMDFLDNSPVNFLAAQTICRRLEKAGFRRLDLTRPWQLEPNGRYYVTYNDSAVFAFVTPTSRQHAAFSIISAHSDSPGFRIKPNCEMLSDGNMLKLNTEVYGGPILYTWFDRPLSIAGRVMLRGKSPLHPESVTFNLGRPIMTIPHLAIHFNRQVNEGNKLSRQKDMLPVVGRLESAEQAKGWLTRLVAEHLKVEPESIIDYDLSLYDTTPACVVGPNGDFLCSGRIDDLSMAHAAMTALIETADKPSDRVRVMAIFDNEETGSGTKQGAASPILDFIMRSISNAFSSGENAVGEDKGYFEAIADSFMISADNAHGVHPNYVEKQDPTNHPVLGGGPVIKINANCKYMTDAQSSAVYSEICRLAGVPCQFFVNHSDVAGGSTLGNILSTKIPLRGVDMGAAIWAMHSAHETASTADVPLIIDSFKGFFSL